MSLSRTKEVGAFLQRATLERILALPKSILRSLVGPRVVSPEGYVLELEAQLLLRGAAVARVPETHELGVRGGREELERSLRVVDYRGVPAHVSKRMIVGPRGSIPVRVYEPRGRFSPRPIVVYFHGGGFVVGSIDSHDGLCRALAEKTGALVVSVDYRLAPEHRFPAGVEDAVAATRYVLAQAKTFGGDPARVAVAGDSAGGNFAAVVAQQLRGDALRPMFQLLVYPATDLTRSFPSHRAFREGFFLTEKTIDWFLANYVNDERDKTDVRGSPLFAEDFAGLPPALVFTAGFDPLRDEGRAYAEKLRAAGVPVEYVCIEGAVHGFFSCGGVFEHASRAVDRAARALRSAFARA
jgi:acetyl esterase